MNNLPMQGVRAIGLKLLGDVGSSAAELLQLCCDFSPALGSTAQQTAVKEATRPPSLSCDMALQD